MNHRSRLARSLLLALGALASPIAGTSSAAPPTAAEIAKRSLDAYYAAGSDLRARVSMRIVNAQGGERKRELVMLRKNRGSAGAQRYYLYFHTPPDVKGTAFLVWKYPSRDDDRWIYIPAIKLVRRIAASDRRSSFVGSDFTYEDISGRDVADETHTLVRHEAIGGRDCYVLESVPTGKADYAKRVSWVDAERWLPIQEKYLDARGREIRVFTADKVEEIGGHWTATQRTMRTLASGQRTEVSFSEVSYDRNLPESLFTERSLSEPPGLVR